MDVNGVVLLLLGGGGVALLSGVYRVIQSYRSDRANSEGTLIERLDARLKDAESRCERLVRERDTAREQALQYRLLAIAKGATAEELEKVSS